MRSLFSQTHTLSQQIQNVIEQNTKLLHTLKELKNF